MSTSRTLCASSCLAILVASLVSSNVKTSSSQVIVSPTIPALESVPITATVIPLTLGWLLIFISALVAVTVFIVLRAKWQRKKMIDVLEQDFQKRWWMAAIPLILFILFYFIELWESNDMECLMDTWMMVYDTMVSCVKCYGLPPITMQVLARYHHQYHRSDLKHFHWLGQR